MFNFKAIIIITIYSFQVELILGEQLTGDGVCTSIKTKQIPISKIAAHNEIETYWGKCPGYYFKKCVLERSQVKTRINYELETQTILQRKCCDGFAEGKGKCIPHCANNCYFASCTGPNECTCYEGYVMQTANTCVPHCDGCQNGDCTHPQFCICHAGYDWDSKRNECRPRCPENCPNGVCIAPDVCECNKGYILHPLSNLCIPHCSVPCHNGVCVAPDFCECKHGYHFINDSSTECEATCSFDCKNGKCVRPNVCACNEGYKKHENGHCHCGKFCVEIDDRCHCLDESQRVKGLQLFDTCDEDNCINGKCTSDWHCECLDGFVKNENNTCISNDTCLEGECTPSEDSSAPSRSTILCECINGVCSTNNTCFCIGGYKISNKTANKCVPSCDLECVNGFCSEPNLCECLPGFKNADNETEWNICYPICDVDNEETGCINGTCIGPGLCQCFDGFELSTEANFTCVPAKISATSPSSSNSIFYSICLLAIVLLAGIVYTIYRRRQFITPSVYQDNHYSTEPISVGGEPSEDL